MKLNGQKGSILIFALMMMVVMFAGALALAKVFYPKIASINQAVYSMKAVFRADSAMEVCLYEARKNLAAPAPRLAPLVAGVDYRISSMSVTQPETDVSANCRVMGNTSFKFRGDGFYRNIVRTLEISQ